MEVDIAVGEPDIGSVRPGENVSFTVLAYPNQVFDGVVTQVREDPTTVNNVVTYTVVTRVNNANGTLLPGMTATATIDVASAPNATVVPLQALQYHPHLARHARSASASQTATSASPWGETSQGSSGQTIVDGGTSVVFLDQHGALTPVPVRVDLLSGTQVAVTPLRGSLAEGDSVVIADSGGATRVSHAASSSAFSLRGMH